MNPFPTVLFRFGQLTITDSLLVSFLLSLLLVIGLRVALAFPKSRLLLEIGYDALEESILKMTTADVRPLVPLVLTQWIFIGAANLIGIVPGVASPTRDLSLAAALALISFLAGHVYAFKMRGFSYFKQYIEPSPFLLPFNIIGELSRTIAMALRLFGNMLSGTLIGAIVVYLAGLLLPIPLMILSLLTGVVQAYIFGVLTLVFAASSIQTATRGRPSKDQDEGEGAPKREKKKKRRRKSRVGELERKGEGEAST